MLDSKMFFWYVLAIQSMATAGAMIAIVTAWMIPSCPQILKVYKWALGITAAILLLLLVLGWLNYPWTERWF